jgi:large repetitive protein
MRWVVALGLLAFAFLPAFMLIGRGEDASRPRLMVAELGAPRPDAPLERRPTHGVAVHLDRSGFEVAGREATVSLAGIGPDGGAWTRYDAGVERKTSFGRETIVVTPAKTEQFLTVERHQGPKTWRWRLDSDGLAPRVGADGAVGFFAGRRLLGMHVEPVTLLDASGYDVTPDKLRWSLGRDRTGWLLELRLDDRELPLPYVIDPAITHRASQVSDNGTAGATSITLNMPAGVADRDLLFMHIAARGGSNMTIATPAGWTALRNANNGTFVRLATFYRLASSEPASYNVTFGGGTPTQQAVGSITAYYGAKFSLGAGVLDVNGATGTGNSATPSAASITTLTANALVIAAYSHGIGNGAQTSAMFTQAAGMTERYDAQSGNATAGNRSSLAADDMTEAAAGVTGAKAVTASASARWVAHQVSFEVDDVNPTVTQNDPGANLRGTVTIDGTASDADSSVASVQFQRSPAGAGTWTNIGVADTTSPYSVSFDTTAVADGLYDLRAVATDVAGNVANSTAVTNRRVDNTNPTGSVTAPATGANVRGTITVDSNSADGGSGVASAQFQRSPAGAGTWTNIGAADTSSPYSASFDTTAVSDGLYDLRVITTDNAGNSATSAVVANVRVDNTNPSGSVTAPAAGANVRGTISVDSNSADGGSGVATAQFQRSPAGAGTWTNIGAADTSSPYSVSFDTTAVSDGLYDLRVVTTDNAGNSLTSAVVGDVRVDNTSPTGSITAPAAGASVRGTISVDSNSADGGSGVASAQFQRSPAGAGTWTNIGAPDTSSPYTASLDTTAISDGLYDLRVITTDNTGNSLTSAVVANVRVDNTNPSGSVTAPAAGANVRGTISVESDSADGGSGVATAQFQRSPAGAGTWTNIGAADTSSPYSASFDTTAVSDGLYDLRVITTDNAGNSATSAVVANVRVDNTNPSGSVTAPSAGVNVRGTISVDSNSADGGSGVASAQFQRSPAGGGVWTNIGAADMSSPYSVSLDTTAVADGLYDLRVVTTDNAGNALNSAVVANVRIDNTSPSGSVTAPAAGASVRGTISVDSSSTDGDSGVASAQFQRSPAGAGTWTNTGSADTSSPYSVSFDTTAVSDGLYDLRVVTTDNAGNSSTSGAVTNVRVDNTSPSGSVTTPAAGANVRGTVAVDSSSADAGSGVASAQFQRSPAGGGVWTNIGAADSSSPYSVSFDTTAVADGLYDLRVVTTDNAGNSATSAVVASVRVDNTNPTGSVTAPAAGADVRGTISVDSSSADGGSGVASAQFQRSPAGAGTWTNIGAADTSSPYSVIFDTTAVADGLYDLRVVTTDNVGNSLNSAVVADVRVDNTNPTGSVKAPTAGADLRGTVSVDSNSADGGSGVASAQFQRSPAGAGAWTSIGAADTSSPYSASFDTTAVSDGLYDLRVITTDNAGNSLPSAAVTNVRVDNTNPTGSVMAPAAAADVRGTIAVDSDSADSGSGVASAQFQRSPAGAGTWTNIGAADTSSPYSVSFDTTTVTDGLYDLRVITADNAGNSVTSGVVADIRVDNTSPTGSITAPAADANVRGTISVDANSADSGSGVASARFQRSPAGAGTWTDIGAADTSSPYSVSFDTTAVADGLYDLRVVTTDDAGNSANSAAVSNVRVDNTNPTGSVTAPTAGASVRGTIAVDADSADGGSGVASAQFQRSPAGEGTWTNIGAADTSSPYSVNLDTTTLADGLYDLRVLTDDNAGNSFTSAVVANVRVDNASPGALFTFPAAGAAYSATSWAAACATAGFCGTHSDSGSGVQQVEVSIRRLSSGLYWDGSSFASGGETYVNAALAGSNWSYAFGAGAFPADGDYTVHVRATDNSGNTEAGPSRTFTFDDSPPSQPPLSFSAFTNASATGGTVYYRPSAAGSFTVTASSSDPHSGVSGYAFPAFPAGWTPSGSGATRTYSYTPDPTEPGSGQDVTATNGAGLVSAPGSFSVAADSTAPTGQSISAPAYVTATSIAFTTGDGSDSQSGLDPTTRLVRRAEAPLAGDVCGSFSFFSGSYTSPDTSVSPATCYRYEVTIADKVGNVSAPVTVTVKVDTTAPSAPSLTFGSLSNAAVTGSTVYYRPSAAGGQFAVTASASDDESGISSYGFPAAAAGWSRNVVGATATYSHSGSPTDPVDPNDVTAQNNAGLDWGASAYTVTPDPSDPVSAIQCDGGACASWYENPVSVTLSGNDTGSGLAEIRYTTDDSDPTATTGTVYSGAFVVSTTTEVRYRGFDRVGNAEAVHAQVIEFDTSGPTGPTLTVTETPADPDQHVSGTELFYRPGGGRAGDFTVDAATSDPQSGIDRVTFPAVAGMSGGGDDLASPYTSFYSWSGALSTVGPQTVTARNNAGTQSSAQFTVTPDSTAPTGQSVDLVDGPYYTALSVPLTLDDGTDAGSGVDAASGVVERQSATLSAGSCTSWSGGWTTVTLVGGADTSVVTNRCYRYRFQISDNVGNQSGFSAQTADAMVDATMPVTSDDAPAGWRNLDVTVTLSVDETGSGVASTQYRVDAGAFQSGTSIVVPAPADHSNDGVHTIDYRSTDVAGNVESLSSATVRIDTTLPVTTDDAPSGWRTSAVTVTLTANDALSGIASTQYRVDGGAFQSGASIVVPAPADHSNDGVHTIDYRSTDVAGNVEPLHSAMVRIDTTLPSGSVSAPAGGTHVNGVVAISAAAADVPSGVTSVTFLVRPNGAGSFSTISTDTTAPYDASWDSTGAAEGDAELKVVVADAAANTLTSALVTVVVDNPPAPTLADPGANVSGTINLQAFSAIDTAQVVFERSLAGSGAWSPIATDTTAPYEASFDTRTVSDEHYDFRAVATDLAGFGGTSPVRTSRVDNTLPTVAMSDPANGAVVGGPNVHLGALASDLGSGIASVRFEGRSAGGPTFAEIATDTSAPFDAAWDASSLTGSYELRGVATDAAGNPAASVSVLVTVDSTAPSVTLGDPGAAVRGLVGLSATTQGAAVARVVFKRKPASGDSWSEIETDFAGPWSATFDTRGVADGLYDLRAQATDVNGTLLATHTREGVRVDNTAPAIVSASPANGSSVESANNLVLVVSEPVVVRSPVFDGAAIAPEISGTRLTFATGSLGQGPHQLSGTLEDAVGNSTAFRLGFTIKVEAHVTLVLGVGSVRSTRSGKQQIFVVPVTLSAPATVQTTLLSPIGRKLGTSQTRLRAGRHTVRMAIPRASVPPGRYTIVVRATSADGTQVVRRVHVTIKPKPAKKRKAVRPKAVAAPAVDQGGGGPPAHADQGPRPAAAEPNGPTVATPHIGGAVPETTPQIPRKPLAAASNFVGGKHRRSLGLVMILLSMGSAVGFLIMVELQRMLPPPRS